jgi:hypothetical protein
MVELSFGGKLDRFVLLVRVTGGSSRLVGVAKIGRK